MKIKKLKSCFACWAPPHENKPKDFDVNISNRDGWIEPEVHGEKHLNHVTSLDPCIKINGERHYTGKYEHMKRTQNPNLVVRRGEEFKLQLTLAQAYDKSRDAITFVFRCRDRKSPSYGQGTLVSVNLTEELGNVYSWSAAVEEVSGNTLTVHVRPSPSCIVGVWDLEIDTKTVERHSFKFYGAIYILFNPWCKYDETYMESEDWREETVLTSDGMIWRGSPNYPTIWKYAQFEKDILDCSMYLMTTIGRLSGPLRADPVNVSRALSAAVNVNDDNGVVYGNWSGNYADGKSPTYWSGSMEILQEYYKTKKPVKYGQCWVFAGILTSVCRALGLPSRVITNFSSAHDQNASITIDYIVDPKGEIIQEYDSIWNFHVWSEAWMKRADLGEACDGWQVIDATPQEYSNGMFRCGPASVAACKQGDVMKPYDIPFLFAEVNADIVYWLYDKSTDVWKLLKKETKSVGQNISTKAPGAFSRLDLTDTYKYSEGTNEERATYLKAMRHIDHDFSRLYFNESFEDVVFKFEYLDDILIGEDFTVYLDMENRNPNVDHEISAVLRVDLVTYQGKFLSSVKWDVQTLTVRKENSNRIELKVSYDDYRKLLQDNCIFVISCLAQVLGTDYQHFDRDDFRLRMPNVEIEMKTTAAIGKPVVSKVKVTNPLPSALKKGKFLIDVPGLEKQLTIDVKEKIQPGEMVIREFKFVPNEPGRQTVAAKFISKELGDVNGFYYFVVND